MRHRFFEPPVTKSAEACRVAYAQRTPRQRLIAAHNRYTSRVCSECGKPAIYTYAKVGTWGVLGACEAHKAVAEAGMQGIAARADGRIAAQSAETKRRTTVRAPRPYLHPNVLIK